MNKLPIDSNGVKSATAIVLPTHTNMLIGVSFKLGSKYAYRQYRHLVCDRYTLNFLQFTQISDSSKKFKTLHNLQDKIERCSDKYTKIVVFNLYYAFQFGAFLARQLFTTIFFTLPL